MRRGSALTRWRRPWQGRFDDVQATDKAGRGRAASVGADVLAGGPKTGRRRLNENVCLSNVLSRVHEAI